MEKPNREIIDEICRSLLLLGADNMLLGAVGSWGDSYTDNDVLADLRGWNKATTAELRQRIEHYETSSSHGYNLGEFPKTA